MNGKRILAAKLLKTSLRKVTFAADALDDIKKAITRSNLRGLIATGKIKKAATNSQSRVRARKIAIQKKKGRQRGKGSHKGSKFSVVSRKNQWIVKVRTQRKFIQDLKQREKVNSTDFREVYAKIKGGYFRSKRHIKLFMTERKMFK